MTIKLIGVISGKKVTESIDVRVKATKKSGTKASVLGVFEPITAILVGTLVFGEALTTSIIAGILISIVAVTFMIMVTKR